MKRSSRTFFFIKKGSFKNYFEKRVGDRAKNVWHGQHFEWFANRVARDCFTEVDLAAIGALSVELRAQTARELIEDNDHKLRNLLKECELWTAKNGSDASSAALDDSWLEGDDRLAGDRIGNPLDEPGRSHSQIWLVDAAGKRAPHRLTAEGRSSSTPR